MPAGGLLLKGKSSKTLWLYHRLITKQYPDSLKCKNSPQRLVLRHQVFRMRELFGKAAAWWWLIQIAFFHGHQDTASWPVLRPWLVVAGNGWWFRQSYQAGGPSSVG